MAKVATGAYITCLLNSWLYKQIKMKVPRPMAEDFKQDNDYDRNRKR